MYLHMLMELLVWKIQCGNDLNSLKLQIMYRFKIIPVNSLARFFFVVIDKIILKFKQIGKLTRIWNQYLKNDKVREIDILYIKTLWYWEDRFIHQCNKVDNMEVRQKYAQLISKKNETVINRGNNLCKNCCWSNWTTMSENKTKKTKTTNKATLS